MKDKLKLIGQKLLFLLKKLGIRVGKDTLFFIIRCFEFCILIFGIIFFIKWSNNSLIITEVDYINTNLPSSFNDFKILQISDVNGKDIGKELVEKTNELNPDIIVFTGDYINASRTTEYTIDTYYFENIKKPIYFIPGEQELDSLIYEELKNKLKSYNVIILDNNSDIIIKGQDNIEILGINDTSFFIENINEVDKKIAELKNENRFQILLSHRPELIDIYTKNDIPLVLSGHALGGQIRLPFVGAIYSSNQGFYPDYTSGFYKQNNTTLYVSRGIGNTFIPIRLFNRPEINLITLKNKEIINENITN